MSDGILKIEAERIGLPATATPIEIRDKVHALMAENAELKSDRNNWRDRAEQNQAELVEARKAIEEKKRLECDLLIEAARQDVKMDKVDEEHYRELFKASPDLCKKRLSELRERRFLHTQESLRGKFVDAPPDPVAEAAALVAEKLSNNKTLSEAQAYLQLWSEKPALRDRYFAAKRVTKPAGGDR